MDFMAVIAKNGKISNRKKKEYVCHCCRQKQPFCWTCPCGFHICSACMEENLWGFTCNAV